MRVIAKTEAQNSPGYCLFTGDLDGPYLDTGFWSTQNFEPPVPEHPDRPDTYPDRNPYIYIHVPFVETMGRAVGMVPKHEVEALQEQLAEYGEKLAKLQAYADSVAALHEAEADVIELHPDPEPVAA